MARINQHIKEVIDSKKVIKTSPIIQNESILGLKEQPKLKLKTDYTRSILWVSMVLITVLLWTVIYNLIF